MTICGYHPRMGVGIAEFSEGLINALVDKSARQGRNLVDHLSHEADEIFIIENFFRNEIAHRKPEDPERDALEAFLGIVAIAKYMMRLHVSTPQDRAQLTQRIHDGASSLTDILATYEAAFEAAPSPAAINRTREAFDKVFGERAAGVAARAAE